MTPTTLTRTTLRKRRDDSGMKKNGRSGERPRVRIPERTPRGDSAGVNVMASMNRETASPRVAARRRIRRTLSFSISFTFSNPRISPSSHPSLPNRSNPPGSALLGGRLPGQGHRPADYPQDRPDDEAPGAQKAQDREDQDEHPPGSPPGRAHLEHHSRPQDYGSRNQPEGTQSSDDEGREPLDGGGGYRDRRVCREVRGRKVRDDDGGDGHKDKAGQHHQDAADHGEYRSRVRIPGRRLLCHFDLTSGGYGISGLKSVP